VKGDTRMRKRNELLISFKKLEIIANYYEFPVVAFFTPVKELRGMTKKNITRLIFLQKRNEKLNKIEEILK
jgi:hypothetical protein